MSKTITSIIGTYEKVAYHRRKGHKTGYSEDYDAYYCNTCNKWLEEICGSKKCEFCNNRPETPVR